MLHPALAQALASAHIDDLHRAAARWHTIGLAQRAAHEPRVAATPTAIPRSASESAPWTSWARSWHERSARRLFGRPGAN